MVTSLEALIERAKSVTMTPAERREQRISFAYGTAKIENESITMEMVVRASEESAAG